MGILSAKKPAPAPTETEKLQAEILHMKDAARVRAQRGATLTDEQVDEIIAEEAQRAQARIIAAERAEVNRQNEIALDKKYRDLACELVRDGKILVSLDGIRLTEITPDLLILCPKCGKPLSDTSHAIYEFAKAWHWTPDAYKRVHAFIIHSARSPLTEQGFAGHLQEPCPYCHERVMGIVQMVVI